MSIPTAGKAAWRTWRQKFLFDGVTEMKAMRLLLGVFLMIATFEFANADIGGEPIVLEKTIQASIDEAWRLWTEPDKLKFWLTSVSNVELKVGGLYELFWEPEHPKQNSTIGCRILKLEPLREIVFEWKGPVPFADIMNVNPLPTWVRVTFQKIGKSQTTVRLEHFGWQITPHWDEAKKWQQNAWLQAFSQL